MFGQCLSSNVGGHALTPPTRHSLGGPLPHQLADRTQAHLKAINLYSVERIVYSSGFLRIIHDSEGNSYVFRTRLPWPHRTTRDVSLSVPLCRNLLKKQNLLLSVRSCGPLIRHHTKCDVAIRLACLIHAASVHPEPGSNSQNRGTLLRRAGSK